MLRGHKHPKDGIGHFSAALTAGVLSYIAQTAAIPMLHESNPHKEIPLEKKWLFKAPKYPVCKTTSSRWFQPLAFHESLQQRSQTPGHRQPTHILHLPRSENKMWWLSSIVVCWNDVASWVRDHNTQRKEPDLCTICPTENTERGECPAFTFCKTEISLFRPICKALAESTFFYFLGPNVLPLSSTRLSLTIPWDPFQRCHLHILK